MVGPFDGIDTMFGGVTGFGDFTGANSGFIGVLDFEVNGVNCDVIVFEGCGDYI